MGGIEVILSLLIFIAIIVLLLFIFRDKIEIRIGEFRYGLFGEDQGTDPPGTQTPTPTSTQTSTPTPTSTGTPTPTSTGTENFWVWR